ncbi:MAG: hypothetical protein ACOYMB_05115 [Patescibacteria group bacterium]
MRAKNILGIFAILIAIVSVSCSKTYDDIIDGNSLGTLTAKISITGSITAGDSISIGSVLTASGSLSTGPIKSFQLDWGDGTSIVTVNVGTPAEIVGNHIYTVVGTCLLKLTVYSGQNATGDQAGASKLIHVVSQLPLGANLTFSGANVSGDNALVNSAVIISGANSTGNIKSFAIDYGDGTNSGTTNVTSNSQISVSKIYTGIGNYQVSLRIYDNVNGTGASASITKTLYVTNSIPLLAVMTFSGTSVTGDTAMVNTSVTVSGANSTGVIHSFNIEFGDGTSTGITDVSSNTGITANKTYSSVGSYSVKLTVYAGYTGTGASTSITKNLHVVNVLPNNQALLIKYDSLYLGNGVWRNFWKLNLALAFGQNYTSNCFLKGDNNGWGMTALSAPIGGYVYFITEGSLRFTVVNKLANGNELWAKLTTNVNLNENSLSIWNVYGCVEIESTVAGTFPIYKPGSIGDQLINVRKLANGNFRISVKSSNGTFITTPGVSPGLKIQLPGNTTIAVLSPEPNDPFGHWFYTDVTPSSFNGGMIKFWILQNVNQTTNYFFWSGSYWSPNSTDNSYSMSSLINPPQKK